MANAHQINMDPRSTPTPFSFRDLIALDRDGSAPTSTSASAAHLSGDTVRAMLLQQVLSHMREVAHCALSVAALSPLALNQAGSGENVTLVALDLLPMMVEAAPHQVQSLALMAGGHSYNAVGVGQGSFQGPHGILAARPAPSLMRSTTAQVFVDDGDVYLDLSATTLMGVPRTMSARWALKVGVAGSPGKLEITGVVALNADGSTRAVYDPRTTAPVAVGSFLEAMQDGLLMEAMIHPQKQIALAQAFSSLRRKSVNLFGENGGGGDIASYAYPRGIMGSEDGNLASPSPRASFRA